MTDTSTSGRRRPIPVITYTTSNPDRALLVTLSSGQMLRGFIEPSTAADQWLLLRSAEAVENAYGVEEYVELTINADHIASIIREAQAPGEGDGNWDDPWRIPYYYQR